MQIEYLQEEYNPSLGCYLKWLKGDKSQIINKLYSISALHYHDRDGYVKNTNGFFKYAEYLKINVLSILDNQPEWWVRIYIDESILTEKNEEYIHWKETFEILMQSNNVQIICIKMPIYFSEENRCHNGLLTVLFRYLVLFDTNVNICLFRDLDNIWTEQHHYFVDKWLDNSNKDICLFLNSSYKRQQILDLTVDDIILDNTFYNTILSGLWNIRKPIGYAYPVDIWHKMFAYIESYTDFVNNKEYEMYRYYGTRFIYGFDELVLTRVVLPIMLNMGNTIYAIPIMIYNLEIFQKLFHPHLGKFLGSLTDSNSLEKIKYIIMEKYWDMTSINSGLAQYTLCLLTNLYYKIITKQSFITNNTIIENIKYKAYTSPILMGIGIYTFNHYNKYDWYKYGPYTMDIFLKDRKKLTLDNFTNHSNLSDYDIDDIQNVILNLY